MDQVRFLQVDLGFLGTFGNGGSQRPPESRYSCFSQDKHLCEKIGGSQKRLGEPSDCDSSLTPVKD